MLLLEKEVMAVAKCVFIVVFILEANASARHSYPSHPDLCCIHLKTGLLSYNSGFALSVAFCGFALENRRRASVGPKCSSPV